MKLDAEEKKVEGHFILLSQQTPSSQTFNSHFSYGYSSKPRVRLSVTINQTND